MVGQSTIHNFGSTLLSHTGNGLSSFLSSLFASIHRRRCVLLEQRILEAKKTTIPAEILTSLAEKRFRISTNCVSPSSGAGGVHLSAVLHLGAGRSAAAPRGLDHRRSVDPSPSARAAEIRGADPIRGITSVLRRSPILRWREGEKS